MRHAVRVVGEEKKDKKKDETKYGGMPRREEKKSDKMSEY